jgi:phosphate transport system substrate-binding protein
MKISALSLIAAAFSLTAISAFASENGFVKLDGSSTVFPISEGVAEEFQALEKGKVKVTVGMSGTGGGFKKLCRNETDVSGASRPILSKEMEDCEKSGVNYIELPVAFDALTIVVSNKNTWLKSITTDELKKIWEPSAQGKILSWNQINPSWPNKAFKLYGPGADSGTFDYFTEAVVGKAKSSRGDYTASEDDNTLVQGVSADVDALGYFGYSYFKGNANKLRAVAVVGGAKAPKKGVAIAPSQETIVDGTYFPLSRPLFIYINSKSLSNPNVIEFSKYFVKSAKTISQSVNYTALPDSVYALVQKRLDSKQMGTAFGGHSEAGLHINDIMARPLSLKFAQKK